MTGRNASQPGLPLSFDMETHLVDLARREFMAAETVEAYLVARDLAGHAARSARMGDRSGHLERALLTALECSWFAANLPEAADEPTPDDLLRICLVDAAALGSTVGTGAPPELLRTWTSLATGLLRAVAGWPALGDPSAPERLAVVTLVTSLGEVVREGGSLVAATGEPADPALVDVMARAWAATGEPTPSWLSGAASA